jgi:hypothetical protein
MNRRKARQAAFSPHSRFLRPLGLGCGAVAISLGAYAVGWFDRMLPLPQAPQTTEVEGIHFTDARRQAAQFVSYDDSIVLSREQKDEMTEALSSIPAPCCSEFSIATCCCPCNLAKSTWGLSKLLITTKHANVEQVRAAATAWLQYTNPDGYSGDVCASGGCNRSFESNGCGGMDKRYIR